MGLTFHLILKEMGQTECMGFRSTFTFNLKKNIETQSQGWSRKVLRVSEVHPDVVSGLFYAVLP